jgi:hypothetical protein
LDRIDFNRRKSNMRGGKRPGAGRPRGAATKRTREIADRAVADDGQLPLQTAMPVGRPSTYRPDYHPDKAHKLALLGLNNEEIAAALDLNQDTLYDWRHKFPEFSEALNRGGVHADGEVASRLYNRTATETTACIFWLKNRQRGKWRDQQEHKHEGTISHELLVIQAIGAAVQPPAIDHEPASDRVELPSIEQPQ